MTSPSPWAQLQGQIVLRPRAFVEGLRPRLRATRRLHEVPRVQRYADRPALATLFHDRQGLSKAARDRLIYMAHVDYGYSLAALG